MATIKLHHKYFDGLQFGGGTPPDGVIQFGPRGGNLPGIAVVDENNPLLDALFASEGEAVEVVTASKVARVYVSPLDPDREFKSRPALIAHIRSAAAKGNGMAKAWLAQFGGTELAEAEADEPEDDGSGVHHSRDGVVMQDPVKPPAGPVEV